MSTIGLDYRLKTMVLNNQRIVKVQLWDTAGQDKYRAITRNYYKGAHGIILLYDITNEKTFDNIKIVLIANKIDNINERKIDKVKGEKLAELYGVKIFECSAKTGEGVNESVFYLVEKIVECDLNFKNKGKIKK